MAKNAPATIEPRVVTDSNGAEAIIHRPVRKFVPAVIDAPEPPAAAPPPATPPEPTAEEKQLEERRKQVLASIGYELPPETPPAAPTAPPASPTPAPATPAPPTPQNAPTIPVPPQETPAERDARLVGTAVEKALTSVAPLLRGAQPPAQAPAPTQPTLELTPADARDLEAVAYLEQKDPQKFAGKADEFRQFYKDNYERITKWQQDNPDKEYNPNNEEHAQWLEEHMPADVPVEVLDEAIDDVKFEKKFQARVAPELQAQKAEKALQEAAPRINGQVVKSAYKLVEAVAPELAKLAKNGEQIDFSKPVLDKIEEADPIAREVLDRHAMALNPLIVTLEKIAVPGLNYILDPSRPVDARIMQEMADCEQILVKAPPEVQRRDGKQFITLNELTAKRREAAALPANQRQAAMDRLGNDYWTLSIDDVEETLIDRFAKEAKKEIEHLNTLADKKLKKRGVVQPAPVQSTPTPPAPTPAPPASGIARPRPPSISTQSDVTPAPGGNGSPPKSFGETAAMTHFR
jgi:hypothetical protein